MNSSLQPQLMKHSVSVWLDAQNLIQIILFPCDVFTDLVIYSTGQCHQTVKDRTCFDGSIEPSVLKQAQQQKNNLSYLQSSSGWNLALHDERTAHWIYMHPEGISIYIRTRTTVIALRSTSNLTGSGGGRSSGQDPCHGDHTGEIKGRSRPPTTLTVPNPRLLRWTSSGVKRRRDHVACSFSHNIQALSAFLKGRFCT